MLYTLHVVGYNVELGYCRVRDDIAVLLTIAVYILLGMAERQCSARPTAIGERWKQGICVLLRFVFLTEASIPPLSFPFTVLELEGRHAFPLVPSFYNSSSIR